jgi:hypothetical protein
LFNPNTQKSRILPSWAYINFARGWCLD